MQQEIIAIDKARSGSPTFSKLVVSVRAVVPYRSVELVIGFPGQPNTKQTLALGDASLYETPVDGLLEVRVVAIYVNNLEVQITQVSPRPGFGAAFVTTEKLNFPFSSDERERIGQSIREISTAVSESNAYAKEQAALIHRKLEQISAASERLGRKDWVLYAAGALTELMINAAFSPEQTAKLIDATNAAFVWLFSATHALLQ